MFTCSCTVKKNKYTIQYGNRKCERVHECFPKHLSAWEQQERNKRYRKKKKEGKKRGVRMGRSKAGMKQNGLYI